LPVMPSRPICMVRPIGKTPCRFEPGECPFRLDQHAPHVLARSQASLDKERRDAQIASGPEKFNLIQKVTIHLLGSRKMGVHKDLLGYVSQYIGMVEQLVAKLGDKSTGVKGRGEARGPVEIDDADIDARLIVLVLQADKDIFRVVISVTLDKLFGVALEQVFFRLCDRLRYFLDAVCTRVVDLRKMFCVFCHPFRLCFQELARRRDAQPAEREGRIT
jgi:hypothetical protein